MKFFIAAAMLTNLQIAKAGLADKLDGIWDGEIDNSIAPSSLPVVARLTVENSKYEVDYFSAGCSGILTLQGDTAKTANFSENMTTGNCLNGTVQVYLIEKNKLLFVRFDDTGVLNLLGELECPTCSINQETPEFRNGALHIPKVDVFDSLGGVTTYEADFSVVPLVNPLTLKLDKAQQK